MQMQFMTGTYDYRLVVLSLVVAIVASYTALILAERVTTSRHQYTTLWLSGGALAMGTGIWAMHFIAMLAFKMAAPMGYDVLLTLMSWLMAVIASAVALSFVSRTTLSGRSLLLGSAFMAAGIVGMHYVGMAAMRMQPAIVYDWLLVALSVGVAFVTSMAALLLAFRLRNDLSLAGLARKSAAAVLMGIAICGMHYTGMLAARFPVTSTSQAVLSLDPTRLATLVGVATLLLLGTLLILSILDQRRDAQFEQSMDSLRRANDELRLRNLYDPLTALPNREQLLVNVERSIARWRREQARFAVIHIDLDGFRALKAEQGYRFSSQLLKRVANALLAAKQAGDSIARVGSDEFVVLIEDLDKRDSLTQICRQLNTTVAAISAGNLRLSASIGAAICPDDASHAEPLLMAADRAVNAARSDGGNSYRQYRGDMDWLSAEERVVQVDLEFALQHGDLIPYYQPLYATAGRRLIGAEALVRWQQRDSGMISPEHFIQVAEKTGLIKQLDQCMLESVCAHIRQWLDNGLHVPPIGLNWSAQSMQQADLADQITTCLRRYKLAPQHFVFEINEAVVMADVDAVSNGLRQLREIGVGVALDDFSASLAVLARLPVQQIKLDAAFVAGLIPANARHSTLVEAMIGLAHGLQLKVVAQAVATEDQANDLGRMHCDVMQGHLLSQPISAHTFATWLQTLAQLNKGQVFGPAVPDQHGFPDGSLRGT